MIGIIGGSGLDNPSILTNVKELEINTKYGTTSSTIKIGNIEKKEIALIARHGRNHTIPPSQINNQANIWALKELGCKGIIATTAVGSLREEISRGQLVVLDQFIDFTRHRKISFFEEFEQDKMKHTPMADPFDNKQRNIIISVLNNLKYDYRKIGTVITIEGPRFSTRAESNMFRLWGADVINMSTAPECILANELEIPYSAIAMSTDYDCWKTDEEPVSWEVVLKTFNANVEKITNCLIETVKQLE